MSSIQVALFDFVPNFCPRCGQAISILDRGRYLDQRITHVCHNCKLHFQHSEHFLLIHTASRAGGDLELTLYGKYK